MDSREEQRGVGQELDCVFCVSAIASSGSSGRGSPRAIVRSLRAESFAEQTRLWGLSARVELPEKSRRDGTDLMLKRTSRGVAAGLGFELWCAFFAGFRQCSADAFRIMICRIHRGGRLLTP